MILKKSSPLNNLAKMYKTVMGSLVSSGFKGKNHFTLTREF
jgi:hypothetical protein